MQNLDASSVLALINGVLFEVSTKNKSINYAYCDDDYLCQNAEFDTFIKLLSSKFELNYDTFPKTMMLEWITESRSEEFLLFSASGTSDDSIKLKLNRISITPGRLLCFLENLDDKKSLYDLRDSLTDVYQKSLYTRLVKNQILKKPNEEFYMLIVDIDDFKGINDTYGHLFGDTVLSEVSKILNNSFQNGKVGRIGGDEFSVMCFDSLAYDDIWNKLYKVNHDVNDINKLYNIDMNISITVGCARYPEDASNYDELFMKADRALYHGKRNGKNCFIIYDDEKHKNITVDVLKRYHDRVNGDGMNSSSFILSLLDAFLNGEGYEDNIPNMLEILGRYFLVDRVIFSVPKGDLEEVKYIWNASDKGNKIPDTMDARLWDIHGQDNIVKMDKVSNHEYGNPLLYKLLCSQNVYSLVRLELGYRGSTSGYIRLDTYSNRTWQLDELELFKIVLRLFSGYIYKMHENTILKKQISFDTLTGLYNYDSFVKEATLCMTDCPKKMALYYINIDKFRYINELFSFKTGDETLIKVAEALKNVYNGEFSLVARSTGSRFIVLDEETSEEGIKAKFNQFLTLSKGICACDKLMKDYLRFKAGIYITNGTENEATSVLDKASLAEKFITSSSKSNYLIFYEAMINKYNFKNELEAYFKVALSNGEFDVYLQPKVNIKTGMLIGAEALSRWRYRGVKLLRPDEFIPVLESTGMITELDYYVFKKVCEYIKMLKDNNLNIVPISVNLSRCHNNFDYYVDKITKIIKEYGIDPKYIEIEITESMFIENIEIITTLIEKLHKVGFLVSMDDFGSGYSNLLLLAKANFDVLKIDKSLCSSILDSKMKIIVSSIVRLAIDLNLNLVCEGVENSTQATSLSNMGCVYAQGFLYDKPITINEFTNKYFRG